MRTPTAQRVIRKAQFILAQHEAGDDISPLLLDWSRAVVRVNCPDAEKSSAEQARRQAMQRVRAA